MMTRKLDAVCMAVYYARMEEGSILYSLHAKLYIAIVCNRCGISPYTRPSKLPEALVKRATR